MRCIEKRRARSTSPTPTRATVLGDGSRARGHPAGDHLPSAEPRLRRAVALANGMDSELRRRGSRRSRRDGGPTGRGRPSCSARSSRRKGGRSQASGSEAHGPHARSGPPCDRVAIVRSPRVRRFRRLAEPRGLTPRLEHGLGEDGAVQALLPHGAAMESNHPSGGLLRPAGFEDETLNAR